MGLIKIALVIMLIAGIVAAAVYYTNSLMIETVVTEGLGDKNHGDSKVTPGKTLIVLFHAVWCGHCVTYLKSNVFMDTYRDKIMTDAQFEDIEFVQYDADSHKDLVARYNIRSFPTIVALDAEGKLINTFSGDRSDPQDLVKFAQAAMV